MTKLSRRSLLTLAAAGAAVVAAKPSAAQGWFTKNLGVQSSFFDPQYYANMNSDLLRAGLWRYSDLTAHWTRYGMAEGRTGHPMFHARSYVARYPDLQAALGTNYTALYNHYVTNGQYEGRNGREAGLLSASLGDVSIAASGRMVGGLDSLFFNGRETVNSFDHGRQVQSALYDAKFDACFNPTQAGVAADGLGHASSSVLLESQQISPSSFRTKTKAAYWVGPGGSISSAGGIVPCHASNLTDSVSNFTVETTYKMERSGDVTLIHCKTGWVGSDAIPAGRAQVVPLTGYHTVDFQYAFEIVAENAYAARLRQMGDINVNGDELPSPVLLTTPDGSTAIGIYCKPVAGAAVTYGAYRWVYGSGHDVNDNASWAAVNRYVDEVPAFTPMVAETVMVVGGATSVHLAIAALMRANG